MGLFYLAENKSLLRCLVPPPVHCGIMYYTDKDADIDKGTNVLDKVYTL